MTEKIYIRNASGGLEPLVEERFETEELLQELIGQHPELLAGEQMRPADPLRWILIKREMPVEGWAVDHLLVDQHSRPTLVEVKRGSNREIRRNIVGQMLDYAATAAGVWSERDLRRIFEESSDNPDDEISNLIGADDEPGIDDFWEQVATNLEANRLRLLFVADEIPAELERVVRFLNEQTRDNLEVLAVEVKQYPGQFGQALVSRVIGQVDAPSGSNSRSPSLSRDELLDAFRPDVREAMGPLFDAIQRAGGELRYRRTAITVRGRCSIFQSPVYLARFWVANGGSFDFSMDPNEDYPQALREFLENWISQFSDDDFPVSGLNFKWTRGWSVDSDNFVKRIDLLTGRLCSGLSELANL